MLFSRPDGAMVAGRIHADGRGYRPVLVDLGARCLPQRLLSGGDGTAVAALLCGDDYASSRLLRYR